jgi:glutamate synthase domain-containing protein 1
MTAYGGYTGRNNPYGDDKVIDACSIFGMMDQKGGSLSGADVVEAMTNMNERNNGLGSGYAVYGIYPKYRDHYAFHVMYDDKEALDWGSKRIESEFRVIHDEEIPMDRSRCRANAPIMWRYFVDVDVDQIPRTGEEDYIVDRCLNFNASERGAYVISSGKDMGVFKGVGWPQEIADIFHLDEYQGYIWISHGRFPTNSPGWWGGAHPFALLDSAIVHNGEISSYGTNRRFLEMLGYRCTFQTDTEIFALSLDFLVRKLRLPVEVVAEIFAPPMWKDIDLMPVRERNLLRHLRTTYGGLMMNGPFSIIFARHGSMVGLTDRIKLRPLIAAPKKDLFFLSSEESAIKRVQPDLDRVWHPRGGEPTVARCVGRSATTNDMQVKLRS